VCSYDKLYDLKFSIDVSIKCVDRLLVNKDTIDNAKGITMK
jgi:hypothetical protein